MTKNSKMMQTAQGTEKGHNKTGNNKKLPTQLETLCILQSDPSTSAITR